jgi:hypothetical protein
MRWRCCRGVFQERRAALQLPCMFVDLICVSLLIPIIPARPYPAFSSSIFVSRSLTLLMPRLRDAPSRPSICTRYLVCNLRKRGRDSGKTYAAAMALDMRLRALMPEDTIAPPTVSESCSRPSATARCPLLPGPRRIASPAVRRYARQVDRGVAVFTRSVALVGYVPGTAER